MLTLVDRGGSIRRFDEVDSCQASRFSRIPFAGVSDDLMIGCPEIPPPFLS